MKSNLSFRRFYFCSALSLFTCGSTVVQAQTFTGKSTQVCIVKMDIQQPDEEVLSFLVSLANPCGQKITLQITDPAGNVLHAQHITSEGFRKYFNLNTLEDGVYRFEVMTKDNSLQHEVSISTVVKESRTGTINLVKKKPGKLTATNNRRQQQLTTAILTD
jgi:hypothetical protein